MKQILKILFLLIIIVIAAFIYALNNIAPYSIISLNSFSEAQLNKLLNNRVKPDDYGLKYENINVKVDQSINLRGWFIYSQIPSKSTVILLHGIAASKERMIPIAKMLEANGYNVVLFDQRANGESGGKYCTYGFYEKKDVSKIIDFILYKDSNQSIGVFGASLGGAIAIQAMADDKRIRCAVIESTFVNLREIVSDYMKRLFGFGPVFISNIPLNRAAEIANFNPDNVKPEFSARLIENPVFMVHGDIDNKINFNYGLRIFNNLKTKSKEWHLIHGADHDNLHLIGGKNLDNSIITFLKKYLN